MADQAENLRRLARAQLAWREMTDRPPETEVEAACRQKKRDGPIIRVFSMARLKPAARAIR